MIVRPCAFITHRCLPTPQAAELEESNRDLRTQLAAAQARVRELEMACHNAAAASVSAGQRVRPHMPAAAAIRKKVYETQPAWAAPRPHLALHAQTR
jgi:hypothetical protein